jgi:pimeloyl-ACP methyl ester carboxylesterase
VATGVIAPFHIVTTDAQLDDLRARLAATRWPDAIVDAGWDYGADLDYIRQLCHYWGHRYDWRAHEAELNRLPQFSLPIAGLRVHCIHQRGRGPRPLPLLITHGWPGSITEMVKILPLLTDPAAHGGNAIDAFDVVVPSIPGFGFSERPTGRGVNTRCVGEMWADLMRVLGYERFAVQGGDFGAAVATHLGLAHPDRVLGIHLNYIPGSYEPHLAEETPPLSDAEVDFQRQRDQWLRDEGGYSHLQGTKPQTAAFALNDSPAGLCAWIVEKFRSWSDCGGEVERRFTKDELLTNVTIYWLTQTIHSSMRLYYESRRAPFRFSAGERVAVPCAIARFPRELPSPPRDWVARGYNVTRWTEMPSGGHFAAMEEPDLLVNDIRQFSRAFR